MPAPDMLAKYARVAIEVGIGLEKGDRVLLVSPIQLPDFTRLLVDTAYEAGAASVDVVWRDQQSDRARFVSGGDEALDSVSGLSHFRKTAFELGASYLHVFAEDPMALAGVDPARISRFQRVNGEFLEPVMLGMGAMEVPWSVISAPIEGWTETVFPDSDIEEATERLWDSIFRACRVDRDDPVEAWSRHLDELSRRKLYLTDRHYASLRYEGPGTDLVLGLPEKAKWEGGGVATPGGRPFAPNLPTEEVFTSPHRLQASGTVRATKPLSYFGDLIDEFSLELSDGKVVGATAALGQDVLDQIVGTDDGSSRFGEAAMVPQSGAVAAEGLVWKNALYDENDACHIALGRSYSSCLEGASSMSRDEQERAGLNQSSVHVDFVVGSPEVDVFGVRPDGSEEPIITSGEWGFEA